jgi:hypothetical protein
MLKSMLSFEWGEGDVPVRQQRDRKLALLAYGLMLLVHLLPRVLLGERSYINIHDNLDSDFLYRVLIAPPDRFMNYDAIIPELLSGLPRLVYPSPFKLSSLLFFALPTFWAYVVLDALVRTIAFWGMYRLIEDHLPIRPSVLTRLVVAASFATLPFYVIYDASVAGQPLVAWALLNLWRERKRGLSLSALALFAFASVLPTSGAFVIAAAGIAWLIGVAISRKPHLWALGGITFLCAAYMIIDFRFIQGIVAPPYESHRSLWLEPGTSKAIGLDAVLERTEAVFLYGRYHSASLHTVILGAVALTGVVAAARSAWRWLAFSILTVLLALALSFTQSFGFYEGLRPIWDAVPFTRGVHVRFHWLLPTLWFVALAVVVAGWERVPSLKWIALILLAWNLSHVVRGEIEAEPELLPSYELLWADYKGKPSHDWPHISFQEFVAEPLFDEIAAYIDRPKDSYRVLSVGMYTSISAFNGFHAADGYHDNYPVEYKARFRKLIAPQLAQLPKERVDLDEWGSRAYLGVREIPKHKLKLRKAKRVKKCNELLFDPLAARDLDVEYIFSACKLKTPGPALHFERSFDHRDSAWRVHLYRVVQPL